MLRRCYHSTPNHDEPVSCVLGIVGFPRGQVFVVLRGLVPDAMSGSATRPGRERGALIRVLPAAAWEVAARTVLDGTA